jgi:hypothetical protein
MHVVGNVIKTETANINEEPVMNMDTSEMVSQPPKNINDATVFDREASNFDYLMTDVKFGENKKLWLQDIEFETLLKLIGHLKSTPTVFINHHYIRNILKTYFDQSYLKKLTETHRKITVKAVFIGAIIRFLILSSKDDFTDASRDSFLDKYPEFDSVESKWELLALIRFERSLQIALQYLQGKGNKQLLLSIAAHLEGSNMQYVTGGQPSPGTKRRVLIFERLSGVRPVKRAKREETAGNTNTNSTSTANSPKKSSSGTGKSKARRGQSEEDDEDDDEGGMDSRGVSDFIMGGGGSDSDMTEEHLRQTIHRSHSNSNSNNKQNNNMSKTSGNNHASTSCAALDLLSKIASEQLEDLGH